jgi:hypothetical protein
VFRMTRACNARSNGFLPARFRSLTYYFTVLMIQVAVVQSGGELARIVLKFAPGFRGRSPWRFNVCFVGSRDRAKMQTLDAHCERRYAAQFAARTSKPQNFHSCAYFETRKYHREFSCRIGQLRGWFAHDR